MAVADPALINAQVAIESKIGEYNQAALRKKVYATTTILDPRFKIGFL